MLKIAVLSDSHLGFGFGTERAEDAFNNFELALKTALKEEPQPQLILLAGDIFHDKIPRQETLGRVIEMLTWANRSLRTRPQILKRVKNGKEDVVKSFIPPIIAVWGTHEKRHPDSTNPVQILEKAGLLYVLHAESILVECGYDRIGIHGLSGVPDVYARDALKSWNPKPFTEGNNIMLIHQNFREVIPEVEHALDFSDLPKDFITFAGHIHHTEQFQHPVSKKPIVFTGSTVSTQLHKRESEKSKGFYIIEFGREKYDIKFIPIRTRPFYYETLGVNYKKPVEILYEIGQAITKIEKNHLFIEGEKPIVKLKLEGKLPEGFRVEDLNLSPIMKDYQGKFILSLDKSKLVSSDSEQHSVLLAQIRDKKLSIDEIGLNLLAKNISLNIGAEKLSGIFHFLAEDELENAENAIEGRYEEKQKKLDYTSRETETAETTNDFESSMVGGQQEQQDVQAQEIEQPQPMQETQPQATPAMQPQSMEISLRAERAAVVQASQVTQAPQRSAPAQAETAVSAAPRGRAAPDPTTLHLAETGLSLLGSAGRSSGRSSAPAPARASAAAGNPSQPRSSPQPTAGPASTQSNSPSRSSPDPNILYLAESGLSKLGGLATPNGPSRSGNRAAAYSPAPAKAAAPAQAKNPNVILTQGGKVAATDASVGLSMLASTDKREKPTIRMKETPGGQTVQKVAGQPHAKPIAPGQNSQPQRRWKMDEEEDVMKFKKGAFDLKKWLNKGQ
ncbi:MAG: metallophosphoesterase [archaeon]